MEVSEHCLEVRDSKFGKGLFATQNISAGSVVCEVKGRILNFNDTILLGDKESHTLQIDTDKYILCEPPFLYSNHSCNPNCGVNDHLELFTLRRIRKGEELFWDYSTSMLERHWQMVCQCGDRKCRQIVTDFDLLPAATQSRYLELNMVLPFIVRILHEQLSKTA
jgi:uncharacterized protein